MNQFSHVVMCHTVIRLNTHTFTFIIFIRTPLIAVLFPDRTNLDSVNDLNWIGLQRGVLCGMLHMAVDSVADTGIIIVSCIPTVYLKFTTGILQYLFRIIR